MSSLKAIIPAAGFGSRMLPLTKSVPKEMLPVGRKPMIQHVVEEAVASGLREICIVIREGKEIIRDYFYAPYAVTGKRDPNLDDLERLMAQCELTFVYQQRPAGVGDALLAARDYVGSNPFVMLIPDQVMLSERPATLQLISRWTPEEEEAVIWTSLVRLSKEETPFFYSSRGFEFEPEEEGSPDMRMGRILSVEQTRERYRNQNYEVRGFGRTIYPPEIFEYLGEDFVDERTGEVDLLKTFQKATERLGHRGVLLEGVPVDLGVFESYYRYLPGFWEAQV